MQRALGRVVGGQGGRGVNVDARIETAVSGATNGIAITGHGGDGGMATGGDAANGYSAGEGFGGDGGTGVELSGKLASAGAVSIAAYGGSGGAGHDGYGGFAAITQADGGNGGDGLVLNQDTKIDAVSTVTLYGSGGDGGAAYGSDASGNYNGGDASAGKGGDGVRSFARITTLANDATGIEVFGYAGNGGAAYGGDSSFSAGQGFGGDGGIGVRLNDNLTSGGVLYIEAFGGNGGNAHDGAGGFFGGGIAAVGGSAGDGLAIETGITIDAFSALTLYSGGGIGGSAFGSNAVGSNYGGDAHAGSGGTGIRINSSASISSTDGQIGAGSSSTNQERALASTSKCPAALEPGSTLPVNRTS